jgi:RND superfamily putative drug exporter
MSNFLFKLGRWCARHPLRTMAAWIVVAVAVFVASDRLGGELVDDYKVPGV